MILLCPLINSTVVLEKGLFVSTETARMIGASMTKKELSFNHQMVPVHIPFKGLMQLEYEGQNNFNISKEQWKKNDLPLLYSGEGLNHKNLIIFPMHGVGDQMYLNVTLRTLQKLYSNLSITLVKPMITYVERWYPYIYGKERIVIEGPVVSRDVMAAHDYYVDAEHFVHIDAYKGMYPPEFYMKHIFCHEPGVIDDLRPKIFRFGPDERNVEIRFENLKQKLGDVEKPVVFLSSVTTGRVRDLPIQCLLDFIELANQSYTLIVSTYRRPDLDNVLNELDLPDIIPTAGMIKSPADLLQVISLSDLVLTTDSGITHLSETLQKPCGTIFNVVTPEERVSPYLYSESLNVQFNIPSVCHTPCYFHTLEEGELCDGMAHINKQTGKRSYYDYPPCMENLNGHHLMALLENLVRRFI